MINKLSEFRAAALECGDDYYSDGSLNDAKIEAAHKIFSHASAGTKLLDFEGNPVDFDITIVGRLALLADDGTWARADESFPSIDEIMRDNLMRMGEEGDISGSILDANLWSLLANDAWLLGGIHARTEFHFASPLRWENLWDERRGRMTVTAREVIGITSFGYSISRPVPALEAIARCADTEKAASASLAGYKKRVWELRTVEKFQEFYDTIPEVARK